MKFFKTPEEVRSDAKKLLKLHGFIQFVSYGALLGLFLLLLIEKKDETNSTLVALVLGFVFLVITFLRIFYYVCPSCSGSLFRLRRRDRPKIYPYCPHCGKNIFPELEVISYDRPDTFFTNILRIIIGVGFIGVAIAGVSGFIPIRYIAIGIVVLLYLTFLLATKGPRKACRECYHLMGRNKFCENCGTIAKR